MASITVNIIFFICIYLKGLPIRILLDIWIQVDFLQRNRQQFVTLLESIRIVLIVPFHTLSGERWDFLALLRSEEHTSELQSRQYLVCRLLLEKKKLLIDTLQHLSIHEYLTH